MCVNCLYWSPAGCVIAGALCKLSAIPVTVDVCDNCTSNAKPRTTNSITAAIAFHWAYQNNIILENDRQQLLLQLMLPTTVTKPNLQRIINEKHKTDKDTIHTYLEFYQNEFSRFVGQNPRLLELGIADGYSLRLWKEYLINAEIHGADVWITDQLVGETDIHCHNVNCGDVSALNTEFANMTFDIVIDDASHEQQHQSTSFEVLFPKVKTGGVYVIEDIVPGVIDCFVGCASRMEIYDFRKMKGRWDDMLLVFRK